jgi:hypothetical protein
MATRQIPYVIIEAHPDRKRPYACPRFGLVDEMKLRSSVLEQLIEFVIDHVDLEKTKSVEDIQTFWDNYYEDNYMDMSPWEATAFIDGVWRDVSFSNAELLEGLIKKRQKIREEEEEEEEEEDEEDEDDKKEH